MGGWNANIGCMTTTGVTGGLGIGERKEMNDRLVSFCIAIELMVIQTMFKLPSRRLYTTHGSHLTDTLETKTVPNADSGSDHNLLVAMIRPKFETVLKKSEDTTCEPQISQSNR